MNSHTGERRKSSRLMRRRPCLIVLRSTPMLVPGMHEVVHHALQHAATLPHAREFTDERRRHPRLPLSLIALRLLHVVLRRWSLVQGPYLF